MDERTMTINVTKIDDHLLINGVPTIVNLRDLTTRCKEKLRDEGKLVFSGACFVRPDIVMYKLKLTEEQLFDSIGKLHEMKKIFGESYALNYEKLKQDAITQLFKIGDALKMMEKEGYFIQTKKMDL